MIEKFKGLSVERWILIALFVGGCVWLVNDYRQTRVAARAAINDLRAMSGMHTDLLTNWTAGRQQIVARQRQQAAAQAAAQQQAAQQQAAAQAAAADEQKAAEHKHGNTKKKGE